MSYIRSAIKSIQRRSVTITAGNTVATDTIAAVVNANAVLSINGSTLTTGGSGDGFAYLTLSGTTVTATRIWSAGDLTITYTVTEYKSRFIKSIQSFLINSGGVAGTYTAPIAAVVLAKSYIAYAGFATADNASGSATNWEMSLTLTSTVLVSAVSNETFGGVQVIAGSVVEFR